MMKTTLLTIDKRMKCKLLSFVMFSVLLSSCGGSSGSSENSAPNYHPQSNIIDIFAKNAKKITLASVESSQIPVLQATNLKYGYLQVLLEDLQNSDHTMLTYSLVYTAPVRDDIATLIEDDGCDAIPDKEEFSYSLTAYDLEGTATTVTDMVNIRLTDEFLKYQWHICNTGQNKIQEGLFTTGVDTNVLTSWLNNGTGTNVDTFVIDTALFKHEDIIAGGMVYDVKDTNDIQQHGTSVAGLIGAKANAYGVRGMAYNTNLYHYDFGDGESEHLNIAFRNVIDKKSALRSQDNTKTLSPLNMSFADIQLGMWRFRQTNTNIAETFVANDLIPIQVTHNYYQGYIFSYLDNESQDRKDFYDALNAFNDDCRQYQTDCSCVYQDNITRSPYVVVVGAVTPTGTHAPFSSSSPNMWLSAPGGTAEKNIQRVGTVTTDLVGCDLGYASKDATSLFDRGGFDNSNCNYTAYFAGTSASAPITTGAVANMLSADADNNITSSEQVKYLLYKTAKTLPHDITPVAGADFSVKTNASGVQFSEIYGFGILDSGKATLAITSEKNATINEALFAACIDLTMKDEL